MSKYVLYGYYRSTCSARLRLAFNFKGLSYDLIPVNLLKGEHRQPEFSKLNPTATVPLLVIKSEGGSEFSIGQSMAALEYLEEAHPEHSLLPPKNDLQARSQVRTLANIIACDVQPTTNLRIMNRLKELGQDATAWSKQWTEHGLAAYEKIAKTTAGRFSVGDTLTLADVCLVPAVWQAKRWGADVDQYPTIMRIFTSLSEDPVVVKAHWQNQPDTPPELRSK